MDTSHLRKCPYHFPNFLTPRDTECHGHSSVVQQTIHNFHCRLLKCPHALSGSDQHNNVPIFSPRTTVEHIFLSCDDLYRQIFES